MKNINPDVRYKTDDSKTIAYARASSHDQKEDMVRQVDVLAIIAVFSARLYGSRSNKNKKLLEDVNKAVSDNLNNAE